MKGRDENFDKRLRDRVNPFCVTDSRRGNQQPDFDRALQVGMYIDKHGDRVRASSQQPA